MNVRAALAAAAVIVAGLYATPVVAEEGAAPAKVETTERGKKGWRPPEGPLFNSPIGGPEAQRRIENVVQASIRRAKKDSFIRIALFSFDRRPIAEDLIDAYKRGVNVQVLLNDHQVTRAMRMMNRAFGHSLKRNSWIRRCNEGCRAHSENLHSKIYLFSRTGVAEKTSIVGSANLTTNALINQWNDGLVVRNDKVFDRLRATFNEMKRDKDVKRPYEVFNINKRYQLQLLPYINARRTSDPIMTILNKVRCLGAVRSGINGRTMIRVDMHRWAGYRGKYIADKIVNLWAAGCNVKLMHGSASEEVRNALTRDTRRGRVPIRSNGFDESGDGVIDRYTHHKYLIISGRYGKNPSERRVYTGSSNWATSGTRGDEIIFRAKGPRLVKQYVNNFDFIWNNGSRPIPYGRARMHAAEPKIGGKAWEND